MAPAGNEEPLIGAGPGALECVLFIGLPGSGKTTFYRERFGATHSHISKDNLGPGNRQARQMALIRKTLAGRRSLVVDNTHPARADRAPVIAAARAHGARVTGYFFESSTHDAVARNSRRTGGARVPAVAIFAAAKRLEQPSLEEGFDRLFRVEARDGEFWVAEWPSEPTPPEPR